MTSVAWLRQGVDSRTYRMNEPLSARLLARIRQGALASPMSAAPVKAAIRRDQSQR